MVDTSGCTARWRSRRRNRRRCARANSSSASTCFASTSTRSVRTRRWSRGRRRESGAPPRGRCPPGSTTHGTTPITRSDASTPPATSDGAAKAYSSARPWPAKSWAWRSETRAVTSCVSAVSPRRVRGGAKRREQRKNSVNNHPGSKCQESFRLHRVGVRINDAVAGQLGEIAAGVVLDPVGQVDRVHAVDADQQDVAVVAADSRAVVGADGLASERESAKAPTAVDRSELRSERMELFPWVVTWTSRTGRKAIEINPRDATY